MLKNEFYLYIENQAVKVSEEVYKEFYRGERKERYFMKDLKTERIVINPVTQAIQIIPSREDSLDRLIECDKQFEAPIEPVEDTVAMQILLKDALDLLSDRERKLI